MGLVDCYASSSSSSCSSNDSEPTNHDDVHHRPPTKKRKTSPGPTTPSNTIASITAATTTTKDTNPSRTRAGVKHSITKDENTTSLSLSSSSSSPLPPLPPSFHNLYATTVRPAAADLPSLHQGRKRVIPHVPGNWPSHLYAEWHPDPIHHAALTSLLDALTTTTTNNNNAGLELTTFLTSDLGAPLPLHVSLSRPFVLRTSEREPFLATLERDIAASGVRAFVLVPDGLAWFRSAEGGRSFLVLRVRSATTSAETGQRRGGRGGGDSERRTKKNYQLSTLLGKCNDLVAAYGQPRLYARSGNDDDDGTTAASREGGGVQAVGGGEEDDAAGSVDDAFHVSIAWSFAVPTADIREQTAAVFARKEFQEGIMRAIRIPVNGVKVKIGNVVTDIALPAATERKSSTSGKGLFGI